MQRTGYRVSAGTTKPCHRNRNGKAVIRDTSLPGNFHNQCIYGLECGECGYRHGANGSDIFQAPLPELRLRPAWSGYKCRIDLVDRGSSFGRETP